MSLKFLLHMSWAANYFLYLINAELNSYPKLNSTIPHCTLFTYLLTGYDITSGFLPSFLLEGRCTRTRKIRSAVSGQGLRRKEEPNRFGRLYFWKLNFHDVNFIMQSLLQNSEGQQLYSHPLPLTWHTIITDMHTLSLRNFQSPVIQSFSFMCV